MSEFVGLLPAAGVGSRFAAQGHRGPKELFEVGGQPVCTFAIEAMRRAGVSRVVVVTSAAKPELRNALGDGSSCNVPLEWVTQLQPRGLADAVAAAAGSLGEADVVFAMPDTMFAPIDAPATIATALRGAQHELWLGVFPTDAPRQLAPVACSATGLVSTIQDKPSDPCANNTWGTLAWRSSFTQRVVETRDAPNLSVVMADAIGRGVGATEFTNGCFVDVGTADGAQRAERWLASGKLTTW